MKKEEVFNKRKEFFEEILNTIRKPPGKIDHILEQSQYYFPPNETKSFYDETAGDFAICIDGKFYNKDFSIYYSLWQLGNILRIGVKIEDEELQGAFASDSHNEVFYIWGVKNDPRIDVAHGAVFYDWEFETPDLYNSYREQERFVLGVRHMHFRVMRIIHDECHKMFLYKNRNSDFSHNEDLDYDLLKNMDDNG